MTDLDGIAGIITVLAALGWVAIGVAVVAHRRDLLQNRERDRNRELWQKQRSGVAYIWYQKCRAECQARYAGQWIALDDFTIHLTLLKPSLANLQAVKFSHEDLGELFEVIERSGADPLDYYFIHIESPAYIESRSDHSLQGRDT